MRSSLVHSLLCSISVVSSCEGSPQCRDGKDTPMSKSGSACGSLIWRRSHTMAIPLIQLKSTPKCCNGSRITNLFVQENFKELERVVTLEHADGRTWRVSFGTAPRKHPRWLQGWDRVAKDNHLKPGDVMVYVLVRNSHFHFTVFDEDGNMRSTSTMNSARARKGPSHSHQEPSITTPDLEHPKTRKRLFESQKEAQVADSPSCQENPEAAVRPTVQIASWRNPASQLQQLDGDSSTATATHGTCTA